MRPKIRSQTALIVVVRPLVLPGIGPPTVASTTNASITSKSPAPTSTDNSDVTQIGNAWSVDGVGIFDHRAVYTFHHGFPEGLQKSNYTLHQRGRGSSPVVAFNPQYDPRNVHIVNGMLALTVPGRQKPSQNSGWRLGCAQVETVADNIQYGSVRTKLYLVRFLGPAMVSSSVILQSLGDLLTFQGLFFYQSDTQEVDIEYLTDPSSLSNNGPRNPIPMWYTNQAVNPADAPATQATGPAPSDCTAAVHEYRIDWTPYYTAFYLDGKLQRKFTTNVPREPGSWIWNNWANGNKGI